MNNATIKRWIQSVPSQSNSAEREILEKQVKFKIKKTGQEFKAMVESDASSQIHSEFRFVSANGISGMTSRGADFANELPINIPSSIYSNSLWLSNQRYVSKRDPKHPGYMITSSVNLGNDEFDQTSQTYTPKKYLCGVVIVNCRFNSYIEISRVISDYYIKFKDCHFCEHFCIKNSEINNIEFENCTFDSRFTEIFELKTNKIIIRSCSFKDLNFSSCEGVMINHIILKDIIAENLNFNKDKFGELEIENAIFGNLLFQPGYTSQPNGYKFSVTNFDGIKINLDTLSESPYTLSKINTTSLTITGVLSSSLFIKDLKTDHIEFTNFTNEGKLRLHNVTLNTKGSGLIADSQLGRAEFSNVSFDKAIKFRIYLSNLTEIVTTNTDFFDETTGRYEHDFKEIRETFRQLKYASFKQGDRLKELQYEKLEFSAYAKSLNGWKNVGNIFILYSNKFSNNHGQNWEFALGWLILLTAIIYFSIMYLLGYRTVWFTFDSVRLAQYLNFALNPLHDFDKIFRDDILTTAGGARVLDVIGRAISGYLIFQFLRAFRKYVK